MSDRVRLRALEQHDSEKCYKWFNDVEVTRHMLVKGPVSLPQEQQWIKSVSEDTVLNTSRPQFVFAIEAQTEGKQTHIGNIGLHGIDYCNQHASLGMCIGEKEYWGKHYGREALLLLIRFAFDELNLHRVELEVFSENERAIRCYKACGFETEGIRRHAYWKRGQWCDVIMMSILKK